jgi:hypothetical protein
MLERGGGSRLILNLSVRICMCNNSSAQDHSAFRKCVIDDATEF